MKTPSAIPVRLYAGATATWRRSLPDYPATAGWTLKYALRGPSDIDSAAAGSDHLIEVAKADTAKWTAGFYTWTAFVENADGERHIVDQGTIEVEPDPTADQRPHVKKVLDAIEALLEGKATRDQQEYEVDGVKIKRMDIDQLLRARQLYKREWKNHLKAQRLAKGISAKCDTVN